MFAKTKAYSALAAPDIGAVREFYGETLGIEITVLDEENGLIQLELAGGDRPTLLYVKPDHQPANNTVLNFPVDDIDAAVDALAERGVEFERYDEFNQDEKGIARPGDDAPGPAIAWFKDPAGNILGVHDEM